MTNLQNELSQLRFNDLTAIGKRLKGGSLGFDPNRRFTRPMKENFAAWIASEFAEGDIRAAMAAIGTDAPKADAPKAQAKSTGDADVDTVAHEIARVLAGLGGNKGANTEEVAAIARKVATEVTEKALAEITLPRPIVVVRKDKDGEVKRDMGIQHESFPKVLQLANVRCADGYAPNVWLVGPAGSGKTTAARNIAKALDLPFYFNGAIDNEYKLLGFTDANGRIVSRPFREAWTNGGVYLFDEVDGSLPGAVLAFNAALANGTCDFPDGNVERHKDCIIIACANTWGTGATSEYVGRMKLDGAFVDRFVQVSWGYDEAMERALTGNDKWVKKVQKVRSAVSALGIKHIVSPRASYNGAALLANGFDEVDVVEMTLRKGLTDDQWRQVRTKAAL